ncbi:MAG: molybdenum ABC transporter ATP-binding protein [Planctomycetota bacterium]
MSGLVADVEVRRGAFDLRARVEARAGEVVSVVGPSGAGKTTLLRCIAGLEPGARGRITVGDEVWLDGSKSLPVHRRRVGFVFQEASLFPHLDVEGNLRYGTKRLRGTPLRSSFEHVAEWLELGPLLGRRPATLSGGERQRVALGRALLAQPRLLLVDEPLSALDAAARERLLPWLEALPRTIDVPVVHVSHSMREVARLADELVWLEGGAVRASGPARELLPLVGAADEELSAVLRGSVHEHDDLDAITTVAVGDERFHVRRLDAEPGDEVRVQVLARDVSIALEPDRGSSILNEVAVVVRRVHANEAGAVLELELAGGQSLYARITRRSLRALDLSEGRSVRARVKSVGATGSHPRAER